MRQIEQLLGVTSKTAAATGSTSTTSSAGQVVFSVPGTLGMQSNAAPLVTFANAVTPSGLVALLKVAAIGAAVSAQLMVAGVSYATLTIPAGQTQVSIPGAGAIAANALVTLNLISVGTTFPGSGLSVILQGVS
ncbi:MAG TPA: hypothetical protein VK752_05170 [Bryobacteraceae bacterium]|jgi:hypothetical protein|nr:hypothetical protein [Bryobacteraceae bacterium]